MLLESEGSRFKPYQALGRALGNQPRYEAPGDLRAEYVRRNDRHRVSEAVPSIMAQSWPWGSQTAVKKKIMKRFFYVTFDFLNFALVAGILFSLRVAGAQNGGSLGSCIDEESSQLR